jgi:hypothetical protein
MISRSMSSGESAFCRVSSASALTGTPRSNTFRQVRFRSYRNAEEQLTAQPFKGEAQSGPRRSGSVPA